MKFYFAPMEGVTDHILRNLHHRYFPGVDKYFTPFFSPTEDGRFTGRGGRDFRPEVNDPGVPVVPQLLTKKAEDFNWAAKALADLGYSEVNLNLGCPSGTVVAKGKGSGALSDLEGLERLLDGIFAAPTVKISVKTRLGRYAPEEFPRLLELFDRYPIEELTVHCRVREDFYRKPARWEELELPLEKSRNPVCCNGDLTTAGRYEEFVTRYPQVQAVMLGRGLTADPALVRRIKEGKGVTREELQAYDKELFEGYATDFGSRRNALGRMKEHWFYQFSLFEGAEKYEKSLRKTTDPVEYEGIVARVFAELPLREEGACPTW